MSIKSKAIIGLMNTRIFNPSHFLDSFLDYCNTL